MAQKALNYLRIHTPREQNAGHSVTQIVHSDVGKAGSDHCTIQCGGHAARILGTADAGAEDQA